MNELYTTAEAAEYLGVSYRTITDWRKKGYISPELTKGGTHLYTKDGLDNRLPPKPAHRPFKVINAEIPIEVNQQ